MRAWLSARSAFATFVFLFLCMVGFVIFDDDASLAMNLLTELLGIGITVFLVERIFRDAQYRREIPARYAATQEVSFLCREAADLWVYLVRDTLNLTADADLVHDVDLTVMDQRLAAVASRIDFDAIAPVSPERKWDAWLFQSINRMKLKIDNCLTRYPLVLDPNAIRLMQQLENSGFFKFIELLPTLRAENARLGSDSLGQLLRNTSYMLSEYLSTVSELCSQAREMQKEVEGRVKGDQVALQFSDEFFQAVIANLRAERHA